MAAHRSRFPMKAVLVAAGLAAVGGCFGWGDPRTSNQGGGSIFTALAKYNGNAWTTFTPDEVQILSDLAPTLGYSVPALSDEQAQAIVDFLVENDINSMARVNELIANPGELVIPDGFLDLFAGIDLSGLTT